MIKTVKELLALVAGLVFLCAGVHFVHTEVMKARKYQQFVVVQGQVTAASLYQTDTNGSDKVFRADIDYAYVHDGKTLRGATPRDGADSVGNYQRSLYDRMLKARDRNTPIDVYVNPLNPEESTIDPTLRWSLILFGLVFAVSGFVVSALVVKTWMQR
jgi:Protein of unknown function (DUF3592)